MKRNETRTFFVLYTDAFKCLKVIIKIILIKILLVVVLKNVYLL